MAGSALPPTARANGNATSDTGEADRLGDTHWVPLVSPAHNLAVPRGPIRGALCLVILAGLLEARRP